MNWRELLVYAKINHNKEIRDEYDQSKSPGDKQQDHPNSR
jgi:hypothetical protein